MKTPMIDQFLTEYAPDSRRKSYKDVSYLDALATELRTLLAERDDLRSRLADAMTTDTAQAE